MTTITRLIFSLTIACASNAALAMEPFSPPPRIQPQTATAAVALVVKESQKFEITSATVLEVVERELIEQGAGEALEVEYVGRQPSVLFSTDKTVEMAIEKLDFDARALRWHAEVAVYEGDAIMKTIELEGRYASEVEVPVLNQRLRSDNVIEEGDIDWVSMPEHRLRKNTILDIKDLLGKAPRRVISEGRPISTSEIENPMIMRKGTMVQMQFATPYMDIRTLGIAEDDGALNDTILVRNQESGIAVQARITGPGTAVVYKPSQVAQLYQ